MTGRTQRTLNPRLYPGELPTGIDLLHDPLLNKGTAFTEQERDSLKLRGLLPPRVFNESEQVNRVMENVRRKNNDLEKYVYMIGLQDRNETLFYRVLIDHLAELMPIVYTPTVGAACQEFGELWRRARGLYISDRDRGWIRQVLRNWPQDDVRVIVVTDGERILGLGDLGANGMGIPIGKLSLYVGCAGIHPAQVLPVTIDVGTNNQRLLNDPLYIGLPHERIRGELYDALIAEFVEAVQDVFPNALIQFEDFGNHNAFRLLEHYRTRVCTFNDDIQGTASVALAGLLGSLRITGKPLKEQRLLFLGAGEAGIGIADLFVSALSREGVPETDSRKLCWFLDSKGMVVESRTDLAPQKRPYAQPMPFLTTLAEAVDVVKPTAIIGVSGQPKTFTPDILRAMAKYNERPIIFALSNPTSKSECSAEEAYVHTEGRGIFASGSPFPPYTYNGRQFVPGQGNNVYIFPGVGMGVVAVKATQVTDEMFLQAAMTLANEVKDSDLAVGRVYPALETIRDVSAKIATSVAQIAINNGLNRVEPPADLLSYIKGLMYQPSYQTYV